MATRHESHIYLPGRNLLHRMNQRGLSSAQLAKAAGVSPATISGILARERRVTVRTARRIAEALTRIPPIDGLTDLMSDDKVA